MLTALEQTGAQSLQRRFFTMKRHFSDKERAFFMDVDFSDPDLLSLELTILARCTRADPPCPSRDG